MLANELIMKNTRRSFIRLCVCSRMSKTLQLVWFTLRGSHFDTLLKDSPVAVVFLTGETQYLIKDHLVFFR